MESVDAVRAKVGFRNRPGAASGQGTRKPESYEKGGGRPHTPQRACMRCGKWPLHPQHLCPARDATCFNCQRIGHFQWCCKTPKSVGEVFPGSDSDEGNDVFLGAVHDSEEEWVSQWWVPLEVNSVPMKFKIDTGADISVMPEEMFSQLKEVSLTPSTRTLHGPGSHTLAVRGKFTASLQYKNRKAEEEIYVIPGSRNALLGLPAIQKLELLSRVDNVETCSEQIIADHPKLFTGLGSLEGEYHIELEPDSVPFSLSTPRRVAIPLMQKVKKELEAMEASGIISRVEQPTDWCAGMVVVPKPSGKIRVCVDLTRLNQSVKRERHIMPSVEQSLAQLGGAVMFSKLDANSGFYQVKLDPESALLTTFITPFGRFCFNRLPFGITSAPEHF